VAGAREIAGRRYALAVMTIARADDSLDEWQAALGTLESLTQRRQFVDALQADGVTDEQFATAVRQAHAGIGTKQLNLFRLLRNKGRMALGSSIASFYSEMVDDERNVARATVRTAVELDDERRLSLQRQLAEQTGKQVELEMIVDPSILGGMTVRIGDRLFDASTRTRLQSLRRELERASR
jgi:F-type H+-transporting ATPase subunit delta